jgi:antitoxin HigA-1
MLMHNPPHPGSVLREYLGELPVTAAAEHLCISRVALSRVLNGRAGISADLALRLGDALGTSADFWMAMQSKYDLWQAAKGRRKRIEPLHRTAA